MADYDNRIFKVHKEFFQPVDCRNIKVVGRLVKKKNVGISEKSLSKKHLNLLVTVKFTHKTVVEFVVNAKSVEKNFRITFSTPAVHFCKLLFKLADSDTVFLGELFFCVKLFLGIHNFNKLRVAHKHGTYYAVFVEGKVVLL